MIISTQDYTSDFLEPSQITFFKVGSGGLHVTINTNRLFMESVRFTEESVRNYSELFGSKEVMEKFTTGKTKTKKEISKRIKNVWDRRWRESDPFAGLSVYKKEGGEKIFIGHVVLGHGSEPGTAEISYLFHKDYWGSGYGKEAVTALVNNYALAIFQDGYLLEGKPLERIVATSRVDNLASIKILENLGMECVGEEEKYGAVRKLYSIDIASILARAQLLKSA